MCEKATLTIKLNQNAEKELSKRSLRMIPNGDRLQLNELERSIHFLRGVNSNASFLLSGFYMFLASNRETNNRTNLKDYPSKVFQSYIHHASLNNISLTSRKIFDHAIRKNLEFSGTSFAKIKEQILHDHALYWVENSNRSIEDAYKALRLLQQLFKRCSKSERVLLEQKSTLGKRIGLLKQYANHSAAHISLNSHELDILDIAHVVVSITLVGEIIRSFDSMDKQSDYYNRIDEAAYEAAKSIFPDIPDIRLFQEINVEQQARLSWQLDEELGLKMFLEDIPFVTSFFK